MANENKYEELDKAVSREIMAEFVGKQVEHTCPDCKGEGCEHCEEKGFYSVEY